jgi:hypothetical protein
MIQGRDIIVVGIQAWDIEIGSNCKNIAEFSSKIIVFIRKSANGQVCYATKHKETIQKKNSNKNGQEDNLVEISKKSWNLSKKHG